MTSRQAGRRVGTVAADHARSVRTRTAPARTGARQTAAPARETLRPAERRRLVQLAVCCGLFVALVGAKLFLPEKMAAVNGELSALLERNMDVQAVFSAVGAAVSGERAADDALKDVYRAVFHPEEAALEASAPVPVLPEPSPEAALEDLRRGTGAAGRLPLPAGEAETGDEAQEAAGLAYILYSGENLPEGVSLEQSVLGFDYVTPVMGTLTSGFGYRDHPVEGEERFHYGIDIAADTGTAIGAFADGAVTAVGESSSYGKYVTVTHADGFSTLYAHCSAITAASGQTVKAGETIARVGETGIATGPHLHLELHRGGEYLNPIYYVRLV